MVVLKINKCSLKKTIEILKDGGVIVYPTDTAYGIGCRAFNKESIERVLRIKKRAFEKGLPVLVNSFSMSQRLVRFDKVSKKIAKKFWPGGLTLILPMISLEDIAKFFKLSIELAKNCLNVISGGRKKLGVRIPDSRVVSYLIKKIKEPIIGTSANISGKGSCYSVEEVVRQFKDEKEKPDLILDGGELTGKRISTVVEFNKEIKILRPGAIKLEEIKKFINNHL